MRIYVRDVGVILLTTILLSSCTQSQITQNLQTAIQMAEIAIPIIGATANVDPAIIEAATKYLVSANTALISVTDEIGSGDPTAVVAAKVTQMLAAIVKPNLPAGTPQNIATAIDNIAAAVARLLTNFATPAGTPKLAPPSEHLKLSPTDLKVLGEGRAKLEANALKIKALHK